MTTQRTDKERIFTAALELADPAQRRAFLDAACGPNRQLLAEVEALLAHDEAAGSFIEEPAVARGVAPGIVSPGIISQGTVDFRPVTEGPGTVIGPYKLLQKIGEGGFGVVYMAEQQHPVRRKVALKIIKPGMDTREVIARFESERQALALMDHPNIARVLDAGATESGRPYFVMELVKGVPITEYCDKNNLPTEKRLELFLAVCHAVQHAHQKGIIHRDIKPSNVMVTLHDGKPVPKVIDFGVAKATSQQLTEKTLFTAYGQMIGTPVYMSPEQAEMSGLDIDTRSDIYSLGVLLYELLTGTTPFDSKRLRDAGYVEMQRIIREEEPPRPSTRVSTLGDSLTVVSSHRSTDPGKLRQLLRGDLDLIVMKAMEKERTLRYETPNSFAQDVERFLNHEEVVARPHSTVYKLRKFAQRNKAAVAWGTAIAAVLLLGTIVSTVLAVAANHQKNKAQANLIALNTQQIKTEVARQQAVTEAERAKKAESLAAEQKNLADKRAKEAEESRVAEAEQRQAADERRQAIEQQKNQIEGLNSQLRRSMEDQRRSIYAAEMNLVRLEAQRGNLARLRELLDQQLPGANEEDLRGWEWTYWYRFLNRAQVLRRVEGFVYNSPDSALAIAPDGKLAAQTRGDKTEWIDLLTGKVIGSVPVRLRLWVNRTSLSNRGRLVETNAVSQWAYWPEGNRSEPPTQFAVWEPSGEKRPFTFPPDSLKHLSFVQLSADGSRVAAIGNDVSHKRDKPACRLLVWDVDSGELLLNQVEQRELNRLTLSRDGKLLVAYVCHSTARLSDQPRDVAVLFDAATGQTLGVVRHNDDVDSAFLLPDGKQLLLCTLGYSGANRKELWSWSVGSEAPRKLTSEQMPDYVKGAVSPDGRLFAVSGHTVSTVRLIDTQRGNLVATLHNEATTIDTLTFSADSQQLVATSTTGEVLRWDLGQDDDLFGLQSKPLGLMSHRGYAVSPDQSRLAYVTAEGGVRLRTVDGEETVLRPENPEVIAKGTRGTALVEFSPDGKFLAYSTTLGDDGLVRRSRETVELFDVAKGKQAWRWAPNSAARAVNHLVFSADSQQVFIHSTTGSIVGFKCNSDGPAGIPLGAAARNASGIWADRSGRIVAAVPTTSVGTAGIVLNMRELPAGQSLGQVRFRVQSGYRLTHSPDGQHLAITRVQPDRVTLWNFAQERQVLEAPGNAIVFSTDGKLAAIGEPTPVTVAGGGGSGLLRIKEAKLWDVATANLIASISLAGNHADEMRFSPDGRRLLTLHGKQALGAGGAIPEVRLWDVASGREIMAIPVAEVNHYIWDAFYDPSGNRLTVMVFAKSMGTSGGWGSTVLDATPLSEDENAQLIARRQVKDLLARNPLPGDAVATLEADPKLSPKVRDAAIALAKKQPLVPDALRAYCVETIAQPSATPQLQQVTLRAAQALREAEPGTLASRVLLGGAQFRAGLAKEALATLRTIEDEPQLEEGQFSDLDRIYQVCREALCLLAEHQLGNTAGVRTHQTALVTRMRAVANTPIRGAEHGLVNGLYYEAITTAGPLRPSFSFGIPFAPSETMIGRSFERMDANGDGLLTKEETADAPIWPDLVAFDENKDGQLTRAEYTTAMRTQFAASRSAPVTATPDYEQQLATCNAALQLQPDDARSLALRARLLAACPDERLRNGKQAVADAKKACDLTKWEQPLYESALAMAYAETGDFAAAVKHQEQALAAVPEAFRAELTTRLELFHQNKKYRLPGRYEAIAGWGRSVDPLGDCEVAADGGTLRIKIPGSQHNLSPLSKGTDAPRVLQAVEGDFTAEVQVTCPIQPQKGLGESTTYLGAGLLVYVDTAHFLRVERNGFFRDWDRDPSFGKTGRTPLSSNAPTVEYWRAGQIADQHADWGGTQPQLPGDSTWLRIERRGSTMRVSLSHDGQKWDEVQTIATTFPTRVQVGVLAINSSGDEFQAEFSQFRLTQP